MGTIMDMEDIITDMDILMEDMITEDMITEDMTMEDTTTEDTIMQLIITTTDMKVIITVQEAAVGTITVMRLLITTVTLIITKIRMNMLKYYLRIRQNKNI